MLLQMQTIIICNLLLLQSTTSMHKHWNEDSDRQQQRPRQQEEVLLSPDQRTTALLLLENNVPHSRPPIGDMHDYVFKPTSSTGHKKSPNNHSSSIASQHEHTIMEWSSTSLQHAKMVVNQRRQHRRDRTIPPPTNFKQSNDGSSTGGTLPLWYKLHLSFIGGYHTLLSLHSRWKEQSSSSDDDDNDDDGNSSTATTTTSSAIDTSTLCGMHAQEAAKHHPKNYIDTTRGRRHHHRHRRLGPQSRVLISGILSPLGLHFTIALHRQCGVVIFLGLDTMFPNDPLSRLEYQERLAVLVEELAEVVELQVPFLGLESKQRDDDDDDDDDDEQQPMLSPERLARNEMLVELRAI